MMHTKTSMRDLLTMVNHHSRDIPTNNPETIATEAVVFLLVGARSHWKCPIGFFWQTKCLRNPRLNL